MRRHFHYGWPHEPIECQRGDCPDWLPLKVAEGRCDDKSCPCNTSIRPPDYSSNPHYHALSRIVKEDRNLDYLPEILYDTYEDAHEWAYSSWTGGSDPASLTISYKDSWGDVQFHIIEIGAYEMGNFLRRLCSIPPGVSHE